MSPQSAPGRAARLWLRQRLAIARRGEELLERKREALLVEQARTREEHQQARRAWVAAAARAELWGRRALVLDGARRLDVLACDVPGEAALELAWSNLMGARLPAVAQLAIPGPLELSARGGSAAAVMSARAAGEATRAAVRCAIAERADIEIARELAAATRRLRALQKRWIPEHEAQLQRLELALDEAQREQSTRVRWLMGGRREPAAHRPTGP